MIIVFFKALMWIVIALFASSLVTFPIATVKENKEVTTRKILILEKINYDYVKKFKAEDIETGNIFTITPNTDWFNSVEVGDTSATSVSINDTRTLLMAWIYASFVMDMFVLAGLFIYFLMCLPDWIKALNKEVTLDLRSYKTKQKELTLKELEKTPEFQAWREDYEKALKEVE